MSSCPICLETISSTKASPDVCDHLFCLQCLTKWSKMESFCPVDRKRFRKILNLDTGTFCEIKRRGRKRKAPTLYDVSAFCEVCKSGERDDTLLLCDSCDLAYHCECLSPPLNAVPSGRWFCPICNSVDRRLEHGELSKKPREESSQPFFQTSSCSFSTQASLETVKSSSDNLTKHPFNLRKKPNRGHSSGIAQSLSFPSTSSSGQLNSVKISKEDYQTLCAHSKSLFLAPGITVSPNRRNVQEFAAKTTPFVSLPNESRKTRASACDSSERLMSNSEVSLVVSLPEKKNVEYDLKNKGSNQNSRSSETSDIIYESVVSQLKGRKTFTSERSKPSNLLTSYSDSDKYNNHSKNQSSNVLVLKTLLLSGTEKQKLDSFEGILNVTKEIRDSGESSDCEIVFDSSNCITISDNLSSGEFEQVSKISTVTSPAVPNSTEISSDNQSVTLNRPASPNIGCLRDGNITETIIDHVSETEDEDDLPNPLDDFEIRSSYYAAKAKMNLPMELKKIEEEYRLTPHKRAKTSTDTSSNNLLEVPQTKKHELERTSASDSKQVFNIIDYTRRVKKGKHLHTSCEILNKYKAFVARNAEKSKSKPNFESVHDLNVFQGPFSQCNFVHGGTKMRFMHFNPSDIPKEDTSSNQFLKSYPTMLSDFQDLSMREDGSLFMKWSMKC